LMLIRLLLLRLLVLRLLFWLRKPSSNKRES